MFRTGERLSRAEAVAQVGLRFFDKAPESLPEVQVGIEFVSATKSDSNEGEDANFTKSVATKHVTRERLLSDDNNH